MTKKIQANANKLKTAELLDGLESIMAKKETKVKTEDLPVSITDGLGIIDGDDLGMHNVAYNKVFNLSDLPSVKIAGIEVPVVRCDTPKGTASYNNRAMRFKGEFPVVTGSLGHSSEINYAPYRVLNPKEVTWYKANISGYEIYLTSGSQLHVETALSKSPYGDEFNEYPETVTQLTRLILVASDIRCKYLNIEGAVLLNNVKFDVSGSLTLSKSIMAAMNVREVKECYIVDSDISYSSTRQTKFLTIKDSYISGMNISGIDSVSVTESDIFNPLKLSTWAVQGKPMPLTIHGVRLRGGEYDFGGLSTDAGIEMGHLHSTSFSTRGFVIERAVDIGHFSGINPIPFIRFGKNNMVVNGEMFLASEFYPINDRDASIVRKLPVEQPQPYGGYRNVTPFQPSFEFGLPGPNTPLWNRALKVLYPETYKTIIPGKMGEMLVSTLLEQIRSRINIFTEYNALSDKQD